MGTEMKPAREFEPMLAATFKDPAQLKRWPYLGSPKLDGFRCIVVDGVALSRNKKPIRNKFIQYHIGRRGHNGLDGELIVGDPTGGNVIGRTSSGVTSVQGEPMFTFWAFDDFKCFQHGFNHRIGQVEDRVESLASAFIKFVPHIMLANPGEMEVYEAEALADEFEGICLRHPLASYKYGRATDLEDTFWKVKRFVDGEAVITKVLQGQRNENEATTNEMGRTKRSTKKANMVPNGMVGTILATDLVTGVTLEIAPGKMEEVDRLRYWARPKLLVGQVCTYKAFDYGIKDKLRHMTFQSLRHPDDVSRPVPL